MSRITDIFTSARDIVADVSEQRWSDTRFLRLLNEGLLDIATETLLFRGHADIPLSLNQYEYQLPADLIILKAAFTDDREIPIISSHVAAQKFGERWRTHETESGITHVIFDQLDNGITRVYPRPKAFPESAASQADLFGIITGITFEDEEIQLVTSTYGIIDTFSFSDPELIDFIDDLSTYGLMQISLLTAAAILTIYYCKHPTLATDTESTLTLGRAFDKSLAHYIAGNCLRSDVDTQNRAYGDEELSFYGRELDKLIKISTSDNVSTKHFNTTYNGMG